MIDEWFFEGKCCNEPLEGFYGFTYKITFHGKKLKAKDKKNLEYPIGSIYIGKKAFTHAKKVRLSKKAKLLPENKGKRTLRTTKDSGWRNYFGSSLELKSFISKIGEENFSREILKFNKTKARNTYEELKAQIIYKVLEIPSFNKWVGGRVYKSQLQDKI